MARRNLKVLVTLMSVIAGVAAGWNCTCKEKVDCNLVDCFPVNCLDGILYRPPCLCCDTCLRYGNAGESEQPQNCNITCPDICCKYGSYKPPGECCYKCVTYGA